MSKSDHIFHHPNEFVLESGEKLSGFQLKYTTLGRLNKERSNIIWICHALTGNSDFTDWWSGSFRDGSLPTEQVGAFDPNEYFIICANSLGGCYGSTGPLSLNPDIGKPFYHSFPLLTNRDIIRAFDLLRLHLEFEKIHTLVGGSLGGQQVLEWAIECPEVFQHIIPVACNAKHSPWGIAINEAQRMAIATDPTWKENDARAGSEGIKAARAMGMISFRTYKTYDQTQAEKTNEKLDDFRAATYQLYQGEKLANRFNAFSYWTLTKAMDNHNVGRGKESIAAALGRIKARTLVIGIDTDILFPTPEQKLLAEHIPHARYETISSLYGHDGFLVEFDQFNQVVKKFLAASEKAHLHSTEKN
ncbi:MAG: homoserine O-acetyltransferase [Bacteroidia bacterium]|nr:homoserine O-acetyltransferase [Bacteroidia bacterium]